MSNNVVEYIIRAYDKTKEGITSALSSVKKFALGVGTNLMNIKAGFEMAGAVVRKFYGILEESFKFEKMTAEFSRLVGGMDKARTHMKMLDEVSEATPFGDERFAAASREMLVMSDGALGYRDSLVLVGDAAAATGKPIEQLAHAVARAYATIGDGQPISRATMELKNMGIITPALAAEMDNLQQAGASNAYLWEMLEKAIGKYKGAMADASTTGNGLMAQIEDQWGDNVREFGNAFMEAGEGGLQYLLDLLKKLNDDGTIADWAERAAGWLSKLKDGAQAVGSAMSWLWERSGLQDAWRDGVGNFKAGLQGVTTLGVGLYNGDGLSAFSNAARDAVDAKMAETAKGFYGKKILGALGDPGGYLADQEQEAEMAQLAKNDRTAAREQQREKDKLAAERQAEESAQKRKKDLADAQLKQDTERYWKEWDEYEKQLAKWEAERLQTERKIAEERARLAEQQTQKELNAAIKGAQAEADAWGEAQSAAQDRLSRARAQVDKAWGWYRDKDSLQAQLDEEKANAEAERQFGKDFDRLQRQRPDWANAKNLSLDQEAVRRVALAREEERAAQVALDAIAANTELAAAFLQTLTEGREE